MYSVRRVAPYASAITVVEIDPLVIGAAKKSWSAVTGIDEIDYELVLDDVKHFLRTTDDLYDLIVKHNYQKAVEIGTSTGHSAIWIAWALSKTGGKLITIEIDKGRHREALANFKKAGLSDYIDARLADAHQLVEELKGPFDFVFSDADKDWYKNYFVALAPKLEIGG